MSAFTDEDELLTVKQIAPHMGLSWKTLQKMCTARQITCYLIGNKWMIKKKDADEWVNARRQKAVNPTGRRWAA